MAIAFAKKAATEKAPDAESGKATKCEVSQKERAAECHETIVLELNKGKRTFSFPKPRTTLRNTPGTTACRLNQLPADM